MMELEHKFCRLGDEITVSDGTLIEGYASLFDCKDHGGDVVQSGAYAASLASNVSGIKMLWQHDPSQPIGVWDEVREDKKGLYVKGRVLKEVAKGRDVAALISAGAIDGLSIGYRAIKAAKNDKGGRLLSELELWEVSLVTFPMLPDARVAGKGGDPADTSLRELAAVFADATRAMAHR